MTGRLVLRVRSPDGTLFEGPVSSIRAEDQQGWFGILPGRTDVIALLPPGLVLFEDAEGEGFVAISGGVLDLRGESCRVMGREARVSRDPVLAAALLQELLVSRRERAVHRREVHGDLEREALRRMVGVMRRSGR